MDADASVALEIGGGNSKGKPLPVRGHTAHVVGGKMVVIGGFTDLSFHLLSFVQEYDFGEGRVFVIVVFNVYHFLNKYDETAETNDVTLPLNSSVETSHATVYFPEHELSLQ